MVARETSALDATQTARLPHVVRDAIETVLRRQAESNIDVASDGEQGKIGYATYVKERLSGFDGEAGALSLADLEDYPEISERALAGLITATPSCNGQVRYTGLEELCKELDALRAAVNSVRAADAAPPEVFVPAASPGAIAIYLANQHYNSHESYLGALAEAMRIEYEAIAAAGFVVQIDCPDLAMGRHVQYADRSIPEFRMAIAGHVEALNAATASIDPDQLRMHLCWGNYESPHHRDVDLADIIDIVLTARPRGLALEAANPRHAHEWKVFEHTSLPDDKILIPGVIDSCTNYIEHPDLVAERIERYASIVGAERVIAGTDCGFATFASFLPVLPRLAWAKLDSLVEGAQRASERLFRPSSTRTAVRA
ncbi:MAG: cobalamin-independent methionine synthase II family protein [Actinomycetota bacterium]|nr:cobalamin-independent methionine synthase II family protein [Actinomycetota bacterium]